MMHSFEYLVRFVAEDASITYGSIPQAMATKDLVGTRVSTLSGNIDDGFAPTSQKKVVRKVLCPVPSTPIIQCIGVNYAKHASEAKFPLPSQPVVFAKPADALADPDQEIYCHPDARSQLDYEGELCFIFGKDCKDVTKDSALDNVLGYTIGNDISARNYVPQQVSGNQMGYGKSFDGFAPIGPFIVSPSVVGDPHKLQLVTKVNGQIRQDESTSDMVWNIKQLIVHLTRGRTVRAGTVCMTGTPSGVGWFHPSGLLKDGDEVEISIDRLGSLSNKIVYA